MKEKRIALIVDDAPANREEIAAHLKSMGHDFDEAASVEGAKEKLAQHDYDYVVLDLCIPVETGGTYADVEFGKSLLQHVLSEFQQTIPILVVSGVAKGPVDIVEIMKLQANGALVSFVVKPFNSERNSNIRKEITGLLDAKENRAEAGSGKRKRRAKKPQPDGNDIIDLACCKTKRHDWKIKVNGKPVDVGQRMLNVFIRFGQAQREWRGKKVERFHASLGLEELGITTWELTASDVTSLFAKIKTLVWPHLKCSILDGQKEENGKRIKERWVLGATIVNLEKAEKYLKPNYRATRL